MKKKEKVVYLNYSCVAYLKFATANNSRTSKCYLKSCNKDYHQGKATEFLRLLTRNLEPRLRISGTNMRALLSKIKWSEKRKEGSTKFFEDIGTIQAMTKQPYPNPTQAAAWAPFLVLIMNWTLWMSNSHYNRTAAHPKATLRKYAKLRCFQN